MNWLGLPVQASRHAAEIDHVLGIEHWMMAILFVFWIGYFLLALFKFRKGANPRARYQGMRSYWSVYLVFLVAAAEGVLLFGYEMPQWVERTRNLPRVEAATVVRVVAEQFAWNIHYPGPDRLFGRTDIALVSSDNPLGLDRRDPAAKDDITTVNQLTLPVDVPVLVHLTSKDMVHSFGLPEMRVKQDAIPGADTPVWFVPSRVGNYEIACAQICGLGHYRMRGFVNIKSPTDYQAFLADEARSLSR